MLCSYQIMPWAIYILIYLWSRFKCTSFLAHDCVLYESFLTLLTLCAHDNAVLTFFTKGYKFVIAVLLRSENRNTFTSKRADHISVQ